MLQGYFLNLKPKFLDLPHKALLICTLLPSFPATLPSKSALEPHPTTWSSSGVPCAHANSIFSAWNVLHSPYGCALLVFYNSSKIGVSLIEVFLGPSCVLLSGPSTFPDQLLPYCVLLTFEIAWAPHRTMSSMKSRPSVPYFYYIPSTWQFALYIIGAQEICIIFNKKNS